MQMLNAIVAIGGDLGNTVPKYDVTPAEIAVLRAIHGEGAVFDIEPVREEKRSNGFELDRLRRIYGGARDTENNIIVNVLFPGAAARVFDTLDDLGLDESFMKPTARASTEELFGGKGDHDGDGKTGGSRPVTSEPAPAEHEGEANDNNGEPPEDLHALTIAKLKELAEAEGIDLGDATKKDDIIAVIEARRVELAAEDDDDEVGDMTDTSNAGDGLFQ